MTNHPHTALERPSQEMGFFHVHSHLWIPSIPTYEGLEITALQPPAPSSGRTFEPLVNVDFAGPGGRLLSSLTRLVCYLSKYTHPLMGFEMIYADGKSILFGSNGGCELSFPIDGPKGERINKVGILDDSHEDYLFNDFPGNNGQDSRRIDRHLSGLQVCLRYSVPQRLSSANSVPGINKLRPHSDIRYNTLSIKCSYPSNPRTAT